MGVVPLGRKPGHFLFEFVGTLALVVLALVSLFAFRDEFSVFEVTLCVFVAVGGTIYLVNVVSVPEIDDGAFVIRYGRWVRRIRPERVKHVRIGQLVPEVRVVESGRILSYRIGLRGFTNGDEMGRAIRSWAAANGVTVHG